MNSFSLMLLVLSLVFTVIKCDSNNTNISLTNEDVREFMDDFVESLIRLYTEDSRDSRDSLDEIMEYFDNDDQEICIIADCFRKKHGENSVRFYH